MKRHWFTIGLIIFVLIISTSTVMVMSNIAAFDRSLLDTILVDTIRADTSSIDTTRLHMPLPEQITISKQIKEQSQSLDSLIMKKQQQIKK